VTRTITPDQARRLLVRGQRFDAASRRRRLPIVDVVREVGAIQAQEPRAAALGIRARLAGVTEAEVQAALYEERSIVRLWSLRGTLHWVPAEDARWIMRLLGPVAMARAKRRLAQLGVDDPKAQAAVRKVLADGPLTRHEVADAVRASGVRLSGDPQMPVHLVMHAVLEGDVIEVAPRGGKWAYALWEHWLEPDRRTFDRDAALAELARRHAHAHPPAGPEDFAAWSGLKMSDARRGFEQIAGELDEASVLGRSAWVPKGMKPAGRGSVRLLPAWDNFLLGHRNRALTVRPEHDGEVLPGGGVLRPSLTIDGMVAGGWRFEKGTPSVEPFAPLTQDAAAVDAEIDDILRFRAVG
jgi:hypothetical protein